MGSLPRSVGYLSEENVVRRKDIMKKLFKFAVVAALVTGIAKAVSAQKAKWMGLSESQIRDKLHTKLDDKMPSEKVDEIGDKIVGEMGKRGLLGEQPLTEVDDAPTVPEETPTDA